MFWGKLSNYFNKNDSKKVMAGAGDLKKKSQGKALHFYHVCFWNIYFLFLGIVLKPNKKYTQVVKKSFHLSQISLDLSSGDAQVQVYVTTGEVKILLATLSKSSNHVAVDLVFSEGENISFHTQNGNGSVHLAGYFLDDEDDFGDFDGIGDEVDSEEEEEVPQLVDPAKAKKGKKVQQAVATTAAVTDEDSSEDDDTFELGDDQEAVGSEEEEDDDEEGEC